MTSMNNPALIGQKKVSFEVTTSEASNSNSTSPTPEEQTTCCQRIGLFCQRSVQWLRARICCTPPPTETSSADAPPSPSLSQRSISSVHSSTPSSASSTPGPSTSGIAALAKEPSKGILKSTSGPIFVNRDAVGGSFIEDNKVDPREVGGIFVNLATQNITKANSSDGGINPKSSSTSTKKLLEMLRNGEPTEGNKSDKGRDGRFKRRNAQQLARKSVATGASSSSSAVQEESASTSSGTSVSGVASEDTNVDIITETRL